MSILVGICAGSGFFLAMTLPAGPGLAIAVVILIVLAAVIGLVDGTRL